jgi:hypothetical protein
MIAAADELVLDAVFFKISGIFYDLEGLLL